MCRPRAGRRRRELQTSESASDDRVLWQPDPDRWVLSRSGARRGRCHLPRSRTAASSLHTGSSGADTMARADSGAAIIRPRVRARRRLRASAFAVVAALNGVVPAVAAAGEWNATNAVSSGSVVAGWTAWVSSPTDSSRRLAVAAPTTSPVTATIQVRAGTRQQTWLGVGGALSDASTSILGASDEARRLLFDPQRADGAHLNLVRLPLTATDFSTSPWTFGWNDAAGTLTAPQQALSQLSVLTDSLMPLQSKLAVVATPWTAPAAMKDSAALNGGSLLSGSLPAYGRMLGAQAAWLRQHGLPLMAMTLGNEPYFSSSGPGGYPSMLMSDSQQLTLADEVAPALANAGVELWAVDHNWSDRAHYDSVEAGSTHRFQASAFHCYGGTPNQMSGVRERPVVTECTGTTDGFTGTFRWDALNLVISAVESGSVGLVLWNLALNEQHGPHTNGCSTCRGVVDVNSISGTVTKNPEFFTLAQLARAADPGAVVIDTDPVAGLPHVAFLEPDGGVGIFAYNDTGSDQVVEVGIDGDPTGSRFVVPAGSLLTIRGAGSFVPGSITLPGRRPGGGGVLRTEHRHLVAESHPDLLSVAGRRGAGRRGDIARLHPDQRSGGPVPGAEGDREPARIRSEHRNLCGLVSCPGVAAHGAKPCSPGRRRPARGRPNPLRFSGRMVAGRCRSDFPVAAIGPANRGCDELGLSADGRRPWAHDFGDGPGPSGAVGAVGSRHRSALGSSSARPARSTPRWAAARYGRARRIAVAGRPSGPTQRGVQVHVAPGRQVCRSPAGGAVELSRAAARCRASDLAPGEHLGSRVSRPHLHVREGDPAARLMRRPPRRRNDGRR